MCEPIEQERRYDEETTVTPEAQRGKYVQKGIWLEYLTVGWNALECVVAVVAGVAAGSIALVSFGFDSAVESLSGCALLWRLRAERKGRPAEVLERKALKLVGMSLLVLAAYVSFDSVRTLWTREHPEQSTVGIGLAIASLIVMPLLARAKRRTAGRLKSAALKADSTQTWLCAYLSGILLGGLVLNALFSWWWADPIAALAMVPAFAKEGLESVQGKG